MIYDGEEERNKRSDITYKNYHQEVEDIKIQQR